MAGDTPDIRIADIFIEGKEIKKIEPNIEITAEKTIDATGFLAMPGIINTHTHIGMSMFRGYNDEKNLMDWLNNVIFPKEALLTPERIYWNSCLSCVEMIKTGTTTFADMYFECEEIAKAVQKTGLRAQLAWSVCDQNGENTFKKIKKYFSNTKNLSDRIETSATIHAPYTCNMETIKKIIQIAKEKNKKIQVHLSETKKEEEIIKERYNKTSTEYLNDLGILDLPVVLAHGIHLTDADIEILKKVNGGVSHNPVSNCKLASGVADIIKLRKNGINVGLGTDGQGSSTTLDMFEVMRLTGYLQKLKYEDPTIIKAYDILKMATIEGAKVLGLENQIGSIEVNKKADIILINLNKTHLEPNNDICTNIVYSANGADVDTAIVNGNILMKKRKLIAIDEEKIIKNTRKIAKDIL